MSSISRNEQLCCAHETSHPWLIAAKLLCERAGNAPPPGVQARYTRALDRLERVRKGTLLIPNAAVRKTLAPVLSTPRIRIDPWPRSVIERSRSTGTPQGYTQNVDRLDQILDYII